MLLNDDVEFSDINNNDIRIFGLNETITAASQHICMSYRNTASDKTRFYCDTYRQTVTY